MLKLSETEKHADWEWRLEWAIGSRILSDSCAYEAKCTNTLWHKCKYKHTNYITLHRWWRMVDVISLFACVLMKWFRPNFKRKHLSNREECAVVQSTQHSRAKCVRNIFEMQRNFIGRFQAGQVHVFQLSFSTFLSFFLGKSFLFHFYFYDADHAHNITQFQSGQWTDCSSVCACSVYNCLSFVCLLVSAHKHAHFDQVYGFTLDWRAPNLKENTQSNPRKEREEKRSERVIEIVHVYLLYANKTSSILFADFILFDLICCGTWLMRWQRLQCIQPKTK